VQPQRAPAAPAPRSALRRPSLFPGPDGPAPECRWDRRGQLPKLDPDGFAQSFRPQIACGEVSGAALRLRDGLQAHKVPNLTFFHSDCCQSLLADMVARAAAFDEVRKCMRFCRSAKRSNQSAQTSYFSMVSTVMPTPLGGRR